MSRRRQDLSRLIELGEVLQLRDLSALAEATAQCRDIGDRISALEAARARRDAEVSRMTQPDPAQRAGIDHIWQQALEKQRQALEAQLTQHQARADILRQRALRSVGRVSALEKIARIRSHGPRGGGQPS